MTSFHGTINDAVRAELSSGIMKKTRAATVTISAKTSKTSDGKTRLDANEESVACI